MYKCTLLLLGLQKKRKKKTRKENYKLSSAISLPVLLDSTEAWTLITGEDSYFQPSEAKFPKKVSRHPKFDIIRNENFIDTRSTQNTFRESIN